MLISFLLILLTRFPEIIEGFSVDTTRFASKTTYNSSLTSAERAEAQSIHSIIHRYCRPIHLTLLLRHGIRNPSKGNINAIKSVLTKIDATNVSSQFVEGFRNVVSNFPLNSAGQLVDQGAQEHRHIGQRVANNYRSLFNNATEDAVSFYATSVKRTVDSCKGFQRGFFEKLQIPSTISNIETRDDLLRFYDLCDRYLRLKHNTLATTEYRKFQEETFDEIRLQYVATAGLSHVNITYDEMAAVYQTAAIEFAVFGTTVLGASIEPSHLMTLEYSADIESYYQLGYGHTINRLQACPLLADMFHNMDAKITRTGSTQKHGRFYFAHAETTVPILGLLGLFNDPLPLKANNFQQQSNRKFRTSKISSFSSNIGFVLYTCDPSAIERDTAIPPGIFPSKLTGHMMMLTFNEVPIRFPFCAEYVCPYDKVRSFYADVIDLCNFNATCSITTGASAPTASGYALILHLQWLFFVFRPPFLA